MAQRCSPGIILAGEPRRVAALAAPETVVSARSTHPAQQLSVGSMGRRPGRYPRCRSGAPSSRETGQVRQDRICALPSPWRDLPRAPPPSLVRRSRSDSHCRQASRRALPHRLAAAPCRAIPVRQSDSRSAHRIEPRLRRTRSDQPVPGTRDSRAAPASWLEPRVARTSAP